MAYQKSAKTKADIGLGSVDNTSDMSKPISTATAAVLATKADTAAMTAALAAKQASITLGTSNQYIKGDLSLGAMSFSKAYTISLASGIAVIYLTSNGLVTGTALFSAIDYVHLDYLLNNPNLGKSYVISSDLKTLTITGVMQAFSGLSILGTPVLGSVSSSAAPNGTQLSVKVEGLPA